MSAGPPSRGDAGMPDPVPTTDRPGSVKAGAGERARTTCGPCTPVDPRAPRTRRAREEVSAGGVVFRVERDAAGAPRPVFLLIRDSYRNWGFPKGHLEAGEGPQCAAVREVAEETGLCGLTVHGAIETIDWYFRFRGRLVHKVCHFFLMRTDVAATCPQREEGITACRWAPFEEAVALVSYANARVVLQQAHAIVCGRRLACEGVTRGR